MTELNMRNQQIREAIEKISLPPRPNTFFAMMQTLQSDHPNSADKFNFLLNHIQNDPALAAKILAKVNTAIYHNRPKCSSIRQAMMLLGTKNVTKLLTESSFQQLSVNNDPEVLWNHCARTAHIAGFINQYLVIGNQSEAYLFGLFHDCGMFIMKKLFAEQYTETIQLAKQCELLLHQLEMDRHGVTHAQVGALLAEKWHLSESVCEAIRLHHDNILGDESVPGKIKDLVAIGHLAFCIENSHSEQPCPIIDKETLALGSELITYLGINWNTLDYLHQKTAEALKQLHNS